MLGRLESTISCLLEFCGCEEFTESGVLNVKKTTALYFQALCRCMHIKPRQIIVVPESYV